MIIAISNERTNRRGTSPLSCCFLSRVKDTETSDDATTSTDILHSSNAANTLILPLISFTLLIQRPRLVYQPLRGIHIAQAFSCWRCQWAAHSSSLLWLWLKYLICPFISIIQRLNREGFIDVFNIHLPCALNHRPLRIWIIWILDTNRDIGSNSWLHGYRMQHLPHTDYHLMFLLYWYIILHTSAPKNANSAASS